MRLRERYRRWTLPTKVSFLGSSVGVPLTLIVSLIFWLYPRPQEKFEWPNALEDMRDCSSPGPCASSTFWLLREPGASFSVGPCPGPRCFEFQLADGPSRPDNESLLQQKFLLRGGGFGVKKGVNPSGGRFWHNESRVTGQGGFQIIFLPDGYLVSMQLRRDARLNISAPGADISVSVLDASVDSLKLLVAVFPSTWKAGESE